MAPAPKAEQYKILADLKRVDDQLFRVVADLAKIPEERKKLNAKSGEAKSFFEQDRGVLDKSEKDLRASEATLREKEDFLKKAEGKMMEVRNNDMYQAALRELAAHREEKGRLEEKTLGLIEGIESARTRNKEAEQRLRAVETETKAAEAVVAAQEAELEALRQKLLAEREKIAVGLDADVSGLYRRLSLRGGNVVAVVDGGRCLGCNIQVRPQLYNEILGSVAVHTCPSCGKILITRTPPADAASAPPVA